MKKIRKTKKVPNGYQIVTFDTISLFTDVPLDRTIWLLFKNKFEKHEVYTNVAKQEIDDMLMLWSKNFHFTFNEGTYKQTVGLAMRFPIGPVFANISMVKLENIIVQSLWKYLSF